MAARSLNKRNLNSSYNFPIIARNICFMSALLCILCAFLIKKLGLAPQQIPEEVQVYGALFQTFQSLYSAVFQPKVEPSESSWTPWNQLTSSLTQTTTTVKYIVAVSSSSMFESMTNATDYLTTHFISTMNRTKHLTKETWMLTMNKTRQLTESAWLQITTNSTILSHFYFFQTFMYFIGILLFVILLWKFCDRRIFITENILANGDGGVRDSKTYTKRRNNRTQNKKFNGNLVPSEESSPQPLREILTGETRINLSWRQCVLYILLVATVISIPWEFIRMYQQEVANKAAVLYAGTPKECLPESLGLLPSLKAWFHWAFSWDHSPCAKYHYAVMVDPLWEVTPAVVLSSAFTKCITKPLEILCSGLGRCFRLLLTEIPVQWQPVVMLVLILFLLIVTIMLCSYRISLPLFLKIEPSRCTPDIMRALSRVLHHGKGDHVQLRIPATREQCLAIQDSGKRTRAVRNSAVKRTINFQEG